MRSSVRAAKTSCGIRPRVGFVAVVNVSPSHAFPQIQKWKGGAGLELIGVTQFVQEQFRVEGDVRRQENDTPEGDGSYRPLPKKPPGDIHGQSAPPPVHSREVRELLQESRRQ